MGGVFELHWQKREYGQVTMQLYRREDNGQLCMIDAYEKPPFAGRADMVVWLTRRLWRAEEALSV